MAIPIGSGLDFVEGRGGGNAEREEGVDPELEDDVEVERDGVISAADDC